MTTNKWILTGTSRRIRTVAQFAGLAEPVWLGWPCSQSGPLGLSAYRHKNLANRTVIDLMVFLFKKKKGNERKKTSKEKKETREISYWKALWHARYTHSDRHSHTHTHTRVCMTSNGPGSDSASASTCASIRESAQPSVPCPLNCKSSQMKNAPMETQIKMANGFLLFLSSGLGPEPGRMSLQGRGRTINKRLTSIDFVAGKGKLVWVCLSSICLAFTSFLVPFPFAFALLFLLCLYISLSACLCLSPAVSLPALMEKNCVLMRRQLYLRARRLFSSFLPWYICRLWSFKLLSIMHNYLNHFLRSLFSLTWCL